MLKSQLSNGSHLQSKSMIPSNSQNATKSFNTMMQYFRTLDQYGHSTALNGTWLANTNNDDDESTSSTSDQPTLLLAYCYDIIREIHQGSTSAIFETIQRAKFQKNELINRLKEVLVINSYFFL